MQRSFFTIGAFSALLCVALGAFGAHSLKLPEHYASIYQTAVEYHMAHSLALLVTAFAWEKAARKSFAQWAGRLFIIGIVLFSGSLYVLSITEIGVLGAITPLGGVAFLTGWALLGLSVHSARAKK
ncbi:DUF423 domain-containing protein [Paenibacillus thermotolerans]|uniref:DUF423 domain-containing protein n=1 Tax=Paenibacillus thermotolerans TaxID=3027807 RepID=UPI0023675619|nr:MULTISPECIES: DUF423 domain-containing protein [unclassified Paenibacillus]